MTRYEVHVTATFRTAYHILVPDNVPPDKRREYAEKRAVDIARADEGFACAEAVAVTYSTEETVPLQSE